MSGKIMLAGAAVAMALAQNAAAAGLDNVRISGFVDAVGSVSDSNTQYLEKIDNTGDWSGTDYGLNVSARIDQKLSVAAQIYGGGDGGSNVVFDWGFGRYQISDSLAVKAGKMKYAGNLVSEYFDVGYAYPWVRPPEAIYSEKAELYYESYNGLSAVLAGGEDTDYSAEVYGGEVVGNTESKKKMLGLVLKAEGEYGELRAGVNHSTISSPGNDEDGKNKTSFTLGAKANWEQWLVMAEYARSEISDIPTHDMYGAFVTVGYQMGKTMPHLTYQKYDMKTGMKQSGWTLGVRHNVGPATALKLEWQRVKPEGGGLFEEQPAETSVNILNAAVNFVF